jgi:hypothetical protein
MRRTFDILTLFRIKTLFTIKQRQRGKRGKGRERERGYAQLRPKCKHEKREREGGGEGCDGSRRERLSLKLISNNISN